MPQLIDRPVAVTLWDDATEERAAASFRAVQVSVRHSCGHSERYHVCEASLGRVPSAAAPCAECRRLRRLLTRPWEVVDAGLLGMGLVTLAAAAAVAFVLSLLSPR